MTLKNAALFALIGMVLLTALAAADFVTTLTGVITGIVPAMKLLTALIYVVASLGVTVFFLVFYKKQS